MKYKIEKEILKSNMNNRNIYSTKEIYFVGVGVEYAVPQQRGKTHNLPYPPNEKNFRGITPNYI